MKRKKGPVHSEDFVLPSVVAAETGQRIPGQEAYLELVKTADGLRAATGELFATHCLSGKQYNVLRTIRRAGRDGATPSQIQAELVESVPDVTRLVDRLVDAGLAMRQRVDGDRRAVRMLLTAEGSSLLKSIDRPLVALHVLQFEHLSKAEIKQLVFLLRKARGTSDAQ
jgi:DNA-binding MarR family transcriptional regulator